MAIILCGKTASGKDTVCKELLKQHPDLKKMVSYTTRPMRDGETDGVTYHFVSNEEFEVKKREGFFLETTEYNVATGWTWKYGSPKNGLDINTVAIFNPHGYSAIKDDPYNIIFYLKCNNSTLMDRLNQRGDNKKEASRRLSADDIDFLDFERKADFVIKNDSSINVTKLAEIIYDLYNGVFYEENLLGGCNDRFRE